MHKKECPGRTKAATRGRNERGGGVITPTVNSISEEYPSVAQDGKAQRK